MKHNILIIKPVETDMYQHMIVETNELLELVKTFQENFVDCALFIDSCLVFLGKIEKEILSQFSNGISIPNESKIYTTIGVYANGNQKSNGVVETHLPIHIAYNIRMRFGRALIINGICVYPGLGVSEESIQKYIDLYQKGNLVHTKNTEPYN